MDGISERRKRRMNEKKLRRKKRQKRAMCFVLFFVCIVAVVNVNNVFGDDGQAAPERTKTEENLYDAKQEKKDSEEISWNLLLVNPHNKLPEGFAVELQNLKNGHAVDKRVYPDLQSMMDDARAQGLSPIICSSYRTQEKQQRLFNAQINKYIQRGLSTEDAEKEAAMWVAVPGTSEHQTGLAVDIVSAGYQQLDKKQETTAEQKWLMENSYKYGFILRYPSDKSDITGIGYEPWHYRYVGKEAAREIYEKGICLEEYLGV